MTWPLQPLLALRRREEAAATTALGHAAARCRLAEREEETLRDRARETAARALGAGACAEGARWASRLRRESELLRERAVEAETRSRLEAGAVVARRVALDRAARGREVVERLEAAWRRSRDLEAARRDQAALDDRPWSCGPGPAG
jgi:hypothetical protein